jgi:hypothetical protein
MAVNGQLPNVAIPPPTPGLGGPSAASPVRQSDKRAVSMLTDCKQRTKPIADRELLKPRFFGRQMGTGNPNRNIPELEGLPTRTKQSTSLYLITTNSRFLRNLMKPTDREPLVSLCSPSLSRGLYPFRELA